MPDPSAVSAYSLAHGAGRKWSRSEGKSRLDKRFSAKSLERSQYRNKKLALSRLAAKLEERNNIRLANSRQARWREHQQLERGNPIRVFRN